MLIPEKPSPLDSINNQGLLNLLKLCFSQFGEDLYGQIIIVEPRDTMKIATGSTFSQLILTIETLKNAVSHT